MVCLICSPEDGCIKVVDGLGCLHIRDQIKDEQTDAIIGLADTFSMYTASQNITGGIRYWAVSPDGMPVAEWSDENGNRKIGYAPPTKLKSIEFSGDHTLYNFNDDTEYKNEDWLDSNLDGDVVDANDHDYPVAFTRNVVPTISATFNTTPNATIKIRAEGTDGINLAELSITADANGVATYPATVMSKAFSDKVALFDKEGGTPFQLTWYVGNAEIATTEHTVYVTYADPSSISPLFKDFSGNQYNKLYDLALSKACGYVDGSNDSISYIADKVSLGISNEIYYNPAELLPDGHPLNAYEAQGGCLCADLAALHNGLMHSLGINGSVLYIWGGDSNTTALLYEQGSTGFEVTFRVLRPGLDNAPLNPHFNYHAVNVINGRMYDASYGDSYNSLSFDETSNNDTPQQTSSIFPQFATSEGWVCPH